MIRLIGSKEQQEAALQLILEEVTWARGLEGMLKGDATGAEAEKPPEEEKGASHHHLRVCLLNCLLTFHVFFPWFYVGFAWFGMGFRCSLHSE